MKLSVVIPVLGQYDMAAAVIDQLFNTIDGSVEVIVIDNGNDVHFTDDRIKTVRYEKTIGVYPTFEAGFINATGDVVAFFHSDLVIWEGDWYKRVMAEFENNPRLGMVGFIGSNEIDGSGGRGLGTISNFQGKALSSEAPCDDEGSTWYGSAAHVHGKVNSGFTKAAVVDGCAMIIRREAWNDIGARKDFPPHHFYDRLISTQLLEKGWEIGVLGIACDHFSGQTVCKEQKYHDMAMEWCIRNKIPPEGTPVNWDATIYHVAEKMWLKEYRDEKHFIPIKV